MIVMVSTSGEVLPTVISHRAPAILKKIDSRPARPTHRSTQPSDRLVAEAAWLYFVRGKKQGEIAKRLSISRPTVISYLRIAKERKLVNIRLDAKHFRMNEVGERLKEHFGLQSAFVISDDKESPQDTKQQVCEVAAHFLPTWLQPGDTLGVSWGETVSQVAEMVPGWPIDGLVVTQLLGSMAEPFKQTSENCSKEIARQLSGYCINLNVPAVCTTAELATALKNEPAIKQQLHTMSTCNKAILSLSTCTADSYEVTRNIATLSDIEASRNRGAVGIITGRFIDADGNAVTTELDDRLICAKHQLLRTTEGFLTVSGSDKTAATLAALRGGYVDHIALDIPLAESVLEAAGHRGKTKTPMALN